MLWDENGWMDATARMTKNCSTSHRTASSTFPSTNYGWDRREGARGGLDGVPLMHQPRHRALYTHPTKHAGVWCVHPYVTDGQSALVSACADGMLTLPYSLQYSPQYFLQHVPSCHTNPYNIPSHWPHTLIHPHTFILIRFFVFHHILSHPL